MELTRVFTKSSEFLMVKFTLLSKSRWQRSQTKNAKMRLMKLEFSLQLTSPMSLATKSPLSTTLASACVSWWNSLITETFTRRSVTTKKGRPTLKRRKFGMFSFRLWGGSELSTCARLCTGTWKVRTCSYLRIWDSNSGTWMSAKSSKRRISSPTPKQGLLTTQVPRSGKTCHTTVSLISGRWVVSFTNSAH